MKKVLFTCLMTMICCGVSYAQKISFQKTYSTTGPTNAGTDIIEQQDGSFIVCGIRSVPVGASQFIGNVFLFKIDQQGDTVWTKELGTANDRELALGMTQLPNSNLVIVGSINTPPDPATLDALIICTDSNGNKIWQKQYGGSTLDYATSVAFDGTNIVVCGITESYGAGNTDAWLLKLNTSGDTLWTKTFGGVQQDNARSIIANEDEYVIAGGTHSFANGQYEDAWIIRTDTSGTSYWAKNFGGADTVDFVASIVEDENSGSLHSYVVVGVKNTSESQPYNGYGSLYLMKVDASGSVVWDKTVNGTPWRREGLCVKQMADKGFIISGYKLDPTSQSQQMYVVRTDNSGNVFWDTAYGTQDSNYYANAVTPTKDGGWVITGAVFHPTQPIRYIFVTKYDAPTTNIVTMTNNEESVMMYPNPSSGNVYLKLGSGKDIISYKVIDMSGRVVQETNGLSGSDVSFNIDIKGMYLVEIATSEKKIEKMLIVQ